MFLKKSLLFTTALALLMFAGQASAHQVCRSRMFLVKAAPQGYWLRERTTITVKCFPNGC